MKTSIVYTVVLAILMSALIACGDGSTGNNINADSASKEANDSMNAAHLKDPTTAFPQPPVTGTVIDSSRTKDSTKK
jgi:hypothetical protein